MSIKELYKNKNKFLSYLVKDMDYSDNPIIIKKKLFQELKRVNNSLNKLNNYIYDNHFIDLVEYLDIRQSELKDYIIRNHKNIKYENSNFINRGDFFVSEDGVKVIEINNDTPGGYIETLMLNSDIPDKYLNPNEIFYKNFIKEIKKIKAKNVFITGSLAHTEDYSVLNFVSSILKSAGIESSIGYFDNLRIRDGKIFHNDNRVDAIFRYYPIDELYNIYDWSDIEGIMKNGELNIINNPISYVFQLKTYYAYLWEQKDNFPKNIAEIIEKIIPLSIRMDHNLIKKNSDKIRKNKDQWLLKDANNREGNNIFIGKYTEQTIWNNNFTEHNGDKYWILQKLVNIVPINGYMINFGVYNIGAKFSGIFTRINNPHKKTDDKSIIVGTCVEK